MPIPTGVAARPPAAPETRLASVDVLKTVAAQVIVWHHLACYGPMSDVVRAAYGQWADAFFDLLSRHGRAAVWVFLVIGGYLAAASLLAPTARAGAVAPPPAWRLVARRYRRLAVPLGFALAAALASAALARGLLEHWATPAAPTTGQILAHLLLLQDVLGLPALSAGVWYVAIDLQLYVVLLATVRLAGRRQGAAGFAVPAGPIGDPAATARRVAACWGVLALLGFWWFGRDTRLDCWAVYFFGAYGLGVVAFVVAAGAGEAAGAAGAGGAAGAAGAADRRLRRWGPLLLLAALGVSALAADLRTRSLIAVAVAAVLAFRLAPRRAGAAVFGAGSRISYSLFVIHYPVCLAVNAITYALWGADPAMNLLGLLIAWFASNVAGWFLYRAVEAGDWRRWVAAARKAARSGPVATSATRRDAVDGGTPSANP